MTQTEALELARVIVVIALVVVAAVLATPPNKVPLALRGLMTILKRDAGVSQTGPSETPNAVPVYKKIISFALVILAFVLAKL